MTKTLIGIDYEGVGCIKITKGTWDPVTAPDSDIWKFYFNSKWAKDVKLIKVFETSAFSTTGTLTYRPAGSGSAWTHATVMAACIIRKSFFSGVIYDFPLFDYRQINASGHFYGARIFMVEKGERDSGRRYEMTGVANVRWVDSSASYTLYDNGTPYTVTPGQPSVRIENGSLSPLIVWRLPGDNTAIQNGTEQAPVAGHDQVRIDSSTLKVSKPGFDVDTATGTQLAFDSSNSPGKVIASGDIAVPAGTSFYEVGYTLPANAVVEMHFYEGGGNIYYPAPPLDVVFGSEYWIDGTKIRFDNPNAACRARFMVLAFDDSAPTSGTNNVLRQFDSGGENVVQFLRPGASASPSFADIVIDSRWPCLQIIKEGYFAVGVGENTHTITYDASGLFPFIKYTTVHGAGEINVSGNFTWDKAVKLPKVAFYRVYDAPDGPFRPKVGAGDCSYVQYSTTGATFYTYRGNPTLGYHANDQDFGTDTVTYEYDSNPIIGIRYYVFGIPT